MIAYPIYRAKLKKLHKVFNDKYFDGKLSDCMFRVAPGWGRSLLAEYHYDVNKRCWRSTIFVSLFILKDCTYSSIRAVLLHEMIHQWQTERGDSAPSHGPDFKSKAVEVGIEPSVYATVQKKRKRPRARRHTRR